MTKFDVEELMVVNYYYFDKSSKRKMDWLSIVTSVIQSTEGYLKHASTRWLRLELSIERTLRQYQGLRSYFLSEGW